jgi:hypothetical protein
VDKLTHVQVQLLELPTTHPVQAVRRVEPTDEGHAVDDDRVGAGHGAEIGEADHMLSWR